MQQSAETLTHEAPTESVDIPGILKDVLGHSLEELGQKVSRIGAEPAEGLRVPMPLASLLRDRFVRLFAHGGEHLDWTAIGGLAAQDAGYSAP